jgi:hypothetical protein
MVTIVYRNHCTAGPACGAGWCERLKYPGAGYGCLLTVGIKPPWLGDRSAPAEVVVVQCLGM